MSTLKRLNTPVPVLVPAPTTTPLDDAFCRMLALVSTVPVKPSTQEGEGAINPDGLDVENLRRLARRWCARMRKEGRFDSDELGGLEVVLEEYTDQEFIDMILGAVLVHGS